MVMASEVRDDEIVKKVFFSSRHKCVFLYVCMIIS